MTRKALFPTVLVMFTGACSKAPSSKVSEDSRPPEPVAMEPAAEAGPAKHTEGVEKVSDKTGGLAAARKILASHESTRELAQAEDIATKVAVELARCASDLQTAANEFARAEESHRRGEELKRWVEAVINVSVAEIAETKAMSQRDLSAKLAVDSAETDLQAYRRSLQEVKARQDRLGEQIEDLKARTETLKTKLSILETVKATLPRPAPRTDSIAAARNLLASHRSTQDLAEADDLAANAAEQLARSRKVVELLEESLTRLKEHLRRNEEMRKRTRAQLNRSLAELAETREGSKNDESRRRDMASAKHGLGIYRRDMHELEMAHAELVELAALQESRIEEARTRRRILEAAKAKLGTAAPGGSE